MAEPRRLRRAVVVTVLVAVVAGGGWWLGLRRPASGTPANRQVPVATARVVRADLTATVQVDGALGYATPTAIVAQGRGLVTALPAPGQVVTRGQSLYELDGRGVPLFYGAKPQWRALASGVAGGPDISELNANLIALGFGGSPGDAFTGYTGAAVMRWQRALGVSQTGVVEVGDVAYAPAALRVAAIAASLGAPVQPGAPVLSGTSTSLVVQAQLPVSQERLVKPGDAVSVTMPDGRTTEPGSVTAISPVAVNPTGNGRTNEPTVVMTVALNHADDTGNLDQAPVVVNVSSATAPGALAVPVNALVALAGGGYAVEVSAGASRHLVAVQPGLFAGSLVQVTGAGVDAGTPVVVPAQ